MRDSHRSFPETSPGEMVLLIYEDDRDLFAFIVQFVKEGLAKGERCVYIAAESRATYVAAALSADGVGITRKTKRGAFRVMTLREFFELTPSQPLLGDASGAIDRAQARLKEAVSEGFEGLRMAIEMIAVGEPELPADFGEEVEPLLEKVAGPGRLTVAAAFQEDRFNPAFLEWLVRTHEKVIARDYVYLRLIALFRSLARTDLKELESSAYARTVRKGGHFFFQGDPASDVYFLTSGQVKLVRTDAEGRSMILRIVPPMEPFGERVFAIGGDVRNASAEALEDSRALVWDGSTLLRVILARPEVSKAAISLLEDRAEIEQSRLEDFLSRNVQRRLARLLLRLGQHLGRKTRRGYIIPVPLSGNDLAELAMTSPYTVSRILAEWRRLDILDSQRRRIVVRDGERLATLAGESAPKSKPRSKALLGQSAAKQPTTL